jgi:hypothetical protein
MINSCAIKAAAPMGPRAHRRGCPSLCGAYREAYLLRCAYGAPWAFAIMTKVLGECRR